MAPLVWYFLGLCASLLSCFAHAATITYDFNITWVSRNPDGQFDRPTIGINGQWPLPEIRSQVGDRVVITVNNQLGNQSTSLHFHGLFMNGTGEMDGAVGVNQCRIPPGGSFIYNFTTEQPGTYWYHSHGHGQYPDGLRGPLIIDDPESPHAGKWDEEIVLTLSDWYHEQMPTLIKHFISFANPTGAEPVPQSALMADTQNLTIAVKPNTTYFIRTINMAALAAHYLWIEGHSMRVIEVDGVWTEEHETDMLYLSAAQRYGVLVTTKSETTDNFAIVGSMDTDLFDKIPPELNPNVTSWLVYDDKKPLPEPKTIDEFDPLDDFLLKPSDSIALFDHVDHSITLDLKMDNLGDGANYAWFNNITYVSPKVPTLYTALDAPRDVAMNPVIYGENTNPFVLEHNEVVEIILNNNDPGKHPFHLHGHNFQLVYRSEEEKGPYTAEQMSDLPPVPMRRDTVLANPNGNIVLRFRADNPGAWLFHCHIEWHMDSGLVATIVEAPLALQDQHKAGIQAIPAGHIDVCQSTQTPYRGNAGGNTTDFLDVSNMNGPPAPPLPAGFTPKGIVALVFSTIAAALGIATIVWYGLGEIKTPGPNGVGGPGVLQ
ncbi:iron transport multicopper oxidase [Trichophyton mentagrophytes]|nr:iron transport multicopper oxidase [Trichophyton mentagrophytes]